MESGNCKISYSQGHCYASHTSIVYSAFHSIKAVISLHRTTKYVGNYAISADMDHEHIQLTFSSNKSTVKVNVATDNNL